jgi:hypothetical protein
MMFMATPGVLNVYPVFAGRELLSESRRLAGLARPMRMQGMHWCAL